MRVCKCICCDLCFINRLVHFSLSLFPFFHIFDLFRVFANWFSKKKHTTKRLDVCTQYTYHTQSHTHMHDKAIGIFFTWALHTHTRTHFIFTLYWLHFFSLVVYLIVVYCFIFVFLTGCTFIRFHSLSLWDMLKWVSAEMRWITATVRERKKS